MLLELDAKHIALAFEQFSVALALIFNAVLLVCISTRTNDQLKPYSKILRQNTLVDIAYALACGIISVVSGNEDF